MSLGEDGCWSRAGRRGYRGSHVGNVGGARVERKEGSISCEGNRTQGFLGAPHGVLAGSAGCSGGRELRGGGGALQELKLISEALAGGPCRGLRNEWSLHRIPGDREAA